MFGEKKRNGVIHQYKDGKIKSEKALVCGSTNDLEASQHGGIDLWLHRDEQFYGS